MISLFRDNAIRRYGAVDVYCRFIDSHGKPGQPGGKIMHVTHAEACRMVADYKAYWVFPPRIDFSGTLATRA